MAEANRSVPLSIYFGAGYEKWFQFEGDGAP
jgi:hypothetical protein